MATYYVNAAPSHFEPATLHVTTATLSLVNNGTASSSPTVCQSYVQRRVN